MFEGDVCAFLASACQVFISSMRTSTPYFSDAHMSEGAAVFTGGAAVFVSSLRLTREKRYIASRSAPQDSIGCIGRSSMASEYENQLSQHRTGKPRCMYLKSMSKL